VNISVKGEYALLAIFDLSSQFQVVASQGGSNENADPVKIADIARRQKIPQKFLELILAGLKQGGFVSSRRGAEGGYILSRRPESLTVGEVLHFVEGHREEKSRRRREDGSPFLEVWQKVDSAIDSVLDSTTFAQVVREWNDKNTKFVPNWEI
jgi:Rrf2 family protein